MATSTRTVIKSATPEKKAATRTAAANKIATKKSAPKKSAKKSTGKTNKLGVKNSLVNNINARKKKGTSRPRKKSTVSKESYDHMENNWEDEQ